jgi:microcystin-dependent protein
VLFRSLIKKIEYSLDDTNWVDITPNGTTIGTDAWSGDLECLIVNTNVEQGDPQEFNVSLNYPIYLRYTDISGTIKEDKILNVAFTLISRRAGGKGVTLGAIATEDGFNCYLDADFKGSITQNGNPIGGGSITIGTMMLYAGSTPPDGWLICDGSAISRTAYSQLFNKIGTTYGTGDGSTTFNIPNFKGRVPVGLDSTQTEFDTLGETGGEKTHTLIEAEIPEKIVGTNAGNAISDGFIGRGDYTVTNTYNFGGNGQPHNNLQPYGVTNIIIRALNTVAEEAPVDSLPIGSILEYDGNTVPEGYSQVEDEMVILYSDTTGSNTSVTLSDSLENYTYAEIVYRSNDGGGYKNSTGKIWNPDKNHVTMTYWFLFGNLYLKYSNAYLDGTSITLTDSIEMYWEFPTNTFAKSDSNNIYIVQVIGYR